MSTDGYVVDRRASPEHPLELRSSDVIDWPGVTVTEQRISRDVFETLQAEWVESIRRSNATSDR